MSEKKESRGFIPLRSLADAQKWLEKAINETEANSTSISRGNSRIASIKAFFGGFRLALDYAKLSRQGARVKEMEEFVRLEQQAVGGERK